MRSLVVDDSKSVRFFLRDTLRQYGACEAAETGVEGVKMFEDALKDNIPFNLVVMDIMLPELNGHDALKQIADLEKEYHVSGKDKAKYIMISSLKDGRNMMRAHYEEGVALYITKPIRRETLKEALINLGFVVHPVRELMDIA
ncbi:response regulator [Desulfovibrio inopinatus]|uniref:response regulator n=1 Tax=Desulfovibrio inopinatus TaxID=102109 RepID=UPI000408EFB7|nr:response regulator [Desulfovibrio inopinatus]